MVNVLFLFMSLLLLLKFVVCKVRMLAICLIECQAGIHLWKTDWDERHVLCCIQSSLKRSAFRLELINFLISTSLRLFSSLDNLSVFLSLFLLYMLGILFLLFSLSKNVHLVSLCTSLSKCVIVGWSFLVFQKACSLSYI